MGICEISFEKPLPFSAIIAIGRNQQSAALFEKRFQSIRYPVTVKKLSFAENNQNGIFIEFAWISKRLQIEVIEDKSKSMGSMLEGDSGWLSGCKGWKQEKEGQPWRVSGKTGEYPAGQAVCVGRRNAIYRTVTPSAK